MLLPFATDMRITMQDIEKISDSQEVPCSRLLVQM